MLGLELGAEDNEEPCLELPQTEFTGKLAFFSVLLGLIFLVSLELVSQTNCIARVSLLSLAQLREGGFHYEKCNIVVVD